MIAKLKSILPLPKNINNCQYSKPSKASFNTATVRKCVICQVVIIILFQITRLHEANI